jgi:hypothetical protein
VRSGQFLRVAPGQRLGVVRPARSAQMLPIPAELSAPVLWPTFTQHGHQRIDAGVTAQHHVVLPGGEVTP